MRSCLPLTVLSPDLVEGCYLAQRERVIRRAEELMTYPALLCGIDWSALEMRTLAGIEAGTLLSLRGPPSGRIPYALRDATSTWRMFRQLQKLK